MAKRRSNSEGTIYRRANGKWRGQISFDGRRISFSSDTQAACREWLSKLKNKQSQGLALNGGAVPLNTFLTKWLDTIQTSKSVSTVENYAWVLKPVLPHISQFSLRDIRPDHLQSLYGMMISAGQSVHAVNRIHKVLHVAFEHALKLKLIPYNPASAASPPKPKQKEMLFLDENQVQTLLLSAELSGDKYYPLYYLAIYTGMRQGELLGLKWNDLDWGRGVVKVSRQLAYRPGGAHEFTSPKTNSSLRTILLGEPAISVLRLHSENLARQRKNKDDKWKEHELIFPSSVGTPVYPANLRRAFRKLLQLSGLPHIRFHDLRHTAASLMLNYGIPLLVASKRLGHSKPSITMDVYGHLIPGRQEEVTSLMDELMTPEALPVAPELHQKQ